MQGRIGKPLSVGQSRDITREFQASERNSVPGDSDSHSKPPGLAIDDFMLWNEMKIEAERRRLPALFVSGEDKKDWVRKEGGRSERPRRDLIEETLNQCGVRLHMLQTSRFLQLAREHLHAKVSEERLSRKHPLR